MLKKLKGHRTKLTALLFAGYNVALAFWPELGKLVGPDTVNAVIMSAIAWFMREGIANND